MTAAMKQTVRVYIADFSGCTTKAGFFVRLTRAFSLDAGMVVRGEAWQALCRRVAQLCDGGIPTRVRLLGLTDAYSALPEECDALFRILRAAEQKNAAFRSEAIIGSAKWKI